MEQTEMTRTESWIKTGEMDARMGEYAPSFKEIEDENEGCDFTYADYRNYMTGFNQYEDRARANGRSVEAQVEHDARGGDFIVLAGG